MDYNRKSITKTDKMKVSKSSADQALYSGLIRLHVLHHACQEPIFGLGMIQELSRHGYRLSPGTLYPIMHSLERKGLLESREDRVDGKVRRVYSSTPVGRKAMKAAKQRVRELFGELFEDEERKRHS